MHGFSVPSQATKPYMSKPNLRLSVIQVSLPYIFCWSYDGIPPVLSLIVQYCVNNHQRGESTELTESSATILEGPRPARSIQKPVGS